MDDPAVAFLARSGTPESSKPLYFRLDGKSDGKPVSVALTQDWTAK